MITPSPIDALIESRFHGAANIKGIRFQILYSVLRAFSLYTDVEPPLSITLERMEDLDVSGPGKESDYVQVKTADKSWNWAKLKDPLKSFLEAHRANARGQYSLVVNFDLKKDLASLAKRSTLSTTQRKNIETKFVILCGQVGATEDESREILSRLTMVSISEPDVQSKLRDEVITRFGLSSEAYDTYIAVLVANFLEWAKDRRTVTRSDLDDVRTKVGEALAREYSFQAYGDGLIQKVSWSSDHCTDDFLDGKSTRSGHIANNSDVERPEWIDRIDAAVIVSKACILRSSSGQGKSTLLFRYAFDHWPAEHTYIIRAVSNPMEVESVKAFIRFRAETNLPIYLLIDNVSWQTQLWPMVVQQAMASGIPIIVSCRHEDWFRFAIGSLTGYEVLEPVLTRTEAKAIFDRLDSVERIHDKVDSAEWAFELLGEPPLLMEFVYLVTHGHLLEDRLRDQINAINRSDEDPAKIEILRRVSIAHSLGSQVDSTELFSDISFRDDPQLTLKSLLGEYLSGNGKWISGLHWVRSNHLAQILHESFPNPVTTIISTIDAVPIESLSQFVSNAFNWQDVDRDELLNQLVQISLSSSTDTVALIVEGVFRAGEYNFFESNRELFDQAFTLQGPQGVKLLLSDPMPIVKTDALSRLAEMEGYKFYNFRNLSELSTQLSGVDRGLDISRRFLESLIRSGGTDFLRKSNMSTYTILDWISLCKLNLPDWSVLRDYILDYSTPEKLTLNELSVLSQAIYRSDPDCLRNWFSENADDILGFLMFSTRSILIDVTEDVLTVEYIVDSNTTSSPNEQSISRLDVLRMAVPFCKQYKSQGYWMVPQGLTPTNDPTTKAILVKNLPSNTDVNKNVIWRELVESQYTPDSFYEYQKHWTKLRKNSISFAQECGRIFGRLIEGKGSGINKKSFESGELCVRLNHLLKAVPDFPSQTNTEIKSAFENMTREWTSGFRNFVSQIQSYIYDESDKQIGRLAVHNIQSASVNLANMHEAWGIVYQNVPDYFEQTDLNQQESRVYRFLASVVHAYIIHPPRTPQRSAARYTRYLSDKRKAETEIQLCRLQKHLSENGMDCLFPEDIHLEFPLKYLGIAFSVNDPICFEDSLESLLKLLADGDEIADIFWLIPIYEGSRFLVGGFQMSSSQISQIVAGQYDQWEAFMPIELPKEAYELLPPLSFKENPEFQFRSNLLLLLSYIPTHDRTQNIIHTLLVSDNRFIKQLGELECVSLQQLRVDIRELAIRTREDLDNSCGIHRDKSCYKIVLQCLGQIEAKLSKISNADLIDFDVLDEHEIDCAIGDLLDL